MTASSGYVAAIGAAVGLVGTMLGGAWAESCRPMCVLGKSHWTCSANERAIAVFGQQTAKAVEWHGSRKLNATGGLMGNPRWKLAIGDDRCEGGLAASVATRHIKQDKINFVIGHNLS